MNIEKLGELKFNTLRKEAEKVAGESRKKAERQAPASPIDQFERKSAQSAPSEDKAQIAAFAENQPDIRADKVAEVRQKIAEHFYEMEKVQQDIADRITRYLIP